MGVPFDCCVSGRRYSIRPPWSQIVRPWVVCGSAARTTRRASGGGRIEVVPPIIETSDLVMEFPSTRALDGLDVSIPPGVTGLVGANGAGKTTLISLCLGLLHPTTGSIRVLGLDPGRNGPELRAQIGYGPERNVFPDDMRAYDFVRHLTEVKGLPRDEARSRASDSLYLVGLGEERFRALGTMSTGQRQRVKLAQAIAADPSFIVLDEPTDGLDPVQRDEMLNIIVQVKRDFGIDVMLSSHVLEEVERVCDHVVALSEGRLIAQGSMAELAGAEGGIEVEMVEIDERPGAIDAVASCLVATGAAVSRSGDTLSIVGAADDELFDRAAVAIADAGGRLRRLGQRRRTLDDLFESHELAPEPDAGEAAS